MQSVIITKLTTVLFFFLNELHWFAMFFTYVCNEVINGMVEEVREQLS
jgi:hypothetical protein